MTESGEGQNRPATGGALSGGRSVPVLGEVFAERYRIDGLLGRGGMGEVYRAVQSPLGRAVALKILKPPDNVEDDPHFESRFLNEAAAAARLNHPNTITVHDFGQTEDGVLYIVMEFLEGRDVRRALLQDGPFACERAVHIARQVARSLREAHKKGIVHRDLKPANVLLVQRDDDSDFVKVLDFGLVKFQGQLTEITLAGKFLGSPRYTSPEALDRHASLDHRADIYSLGILLFTMVCGKPPFDGDVLQVLNAHIYETPPKMREVHPEGQISAALEEVVAKCLEKRPENRYSSMEDLILALGSVSGESSLSLSLDLESVSDDSLGPGKPGIQDTDEEAALRRAGNLPSEVTTAKLRQIADPVSDVYEKSNETSTILRSLDEAVGNPIWQFLRRPDGGPATWFLVGLLFVGALGLAQVLGPLGSGEPSGDSRELILDVVLDRGDVEVSYRDASGAWQSLGIPPLEASVAVPSAWSAVLLRLTPAGQPSVFVEAEISQGRASWTGSPLTLEAESVPPTAGSSEALPGPKGLSDDGSETSAGLGVPAASEGSERAPGSESTQGKGADISDSRSEPAPRKLSPKAPKPSQSPASSEPKPDGSGVEKSSPLPSGYKDNPY